MIYFLLVSSACYCQDTARAENTMSADSFVLVLKRKNAEFIGKPFPQFSVTGNHGINSNKLIKGKVVFINFWFAACPPCLAEMETLNKLYNHFKNFKNFEFISFTFESVTKIQAIKKKFSIQYPVYSISRDECYRLNFNNGFPTSIILDKDELAQFIHPSDELNKKEINYFFVSNIYPILSEELMND